MTEEIKQAEAHAEETQTETASSDPRESKAFKGLAKQAADLRAKLAEYEKREAEAAKVRELEKAKADQTLETVIKERESTIEQQKREFAQFRVENSLRLEAARNGVTNDLLVEGLVSKFRNLPEPPEDIATWVRSFAEAEEYAPLFGKQRTQVHSTGPTSRVATRSTGVIDPDLAERARKLEPAALAELKAKIASGEIKAEQLAELRKRK